MSLPPLPEPVVIDRHLPTGYVIRGYTADQLREAQRAVAEECARLCSPSFEPSPGEPWDDGYQQATEDCAAIIRAKFLKED